MAKYRIADVVVEMQPAYSTLRVQSEPYMINEDAAADFTIALPDEFLEFKRQKNPHLSIDDCEYLWYGFDFYRKLPAYGGIMLHSSCIAVDGEAYLFSAPCGTGKSTHTSLWKRFFGDRAVFINDDKPALRIVDGKIYAYGTPFSGKTDLNTNMCAPVKGICILGRDNENHIHRVSAKQALPKFLNQIFRPTDAEMMKCTLGIMDTIFATVPVYELYCNISDEAVMTSYNGMNTVE